MANKIFREMLKPQAHLSRNGFDRSALRNFTGKIGELLPVFALETIPGSHYEIKVSDLMRSIPMYRPAFLRANQHFEFYFVPYKQLWRQWDNFYTTRDSGNSSIQSLNSVPSAVPTITLSSFGILQTLRSHYSSSSEGISGTFEGPLGEYVGAGCSKVLNLLGYRGIGDIAWDAASSSINWSNYYNSAVRPNVFRLAAYQKIFHDYYRNPFYDLPSSRDSFAYSLDDSPTNGVLPVTVSVLGQTFSRLSVLSQLHYRQWKKDLYMGVLPSTQFGAVSVVNTGGSSSGQTINLDLPVTGFIEGQDVSITSVRYPSGLPINDEEGSILKVGEPYVPNSDAHIIADNGVDEPSNVNFRGSFDTISLNGSTTVARGSATIPASAGGSFDVLSLVRANAIQRWREITLRAGYRATDQYEAHFGVRPIFSEKDKCVFIDSVSAPFTVNTVVNQAGSEYQSLGEQAANGLSSISGNKTIKFDAKDFGVIMCIWSMLPEAVYDNKGIDLMNQKVLHDDFLIPEYENIGLQPLTMLALDARLNTANKGYVPRYSEYKIGLDLQSTEFWDDGRFAGWSPSRTVQSSSQDWTSFGFYVDPRFYRDIFIQRPWLEDNQATIGESSTDSFIHQCYFDVKCVQPISVLGLPSY